MFHHNNRCQEPLKIVLGASALMDVPHSVSCTGLPGCTIQEVGPVNFVLPIREEAALENPCFLMPRVSTANEDAWWYDMVSFTSWEKSDVLPFR